MNIDSSACVVNIDSELIVRKCELRWVVERVWRLCLALCHECMVRICWQSCWVLCICVDVRRVVIVTAARHIVAIAGFWRMCFLDPYSVWAVCLCVWNCVCEFWSIWDCVSQRC